MSSQVTPLFPRIVYSFNVGDINYRNTISPAFTYVTDETAALTYTDNGKVDCREFNVLISVLLEVGIGLTQQNATISAHQNNIINACKCNSCPQPVQNFPDLFTIYFIFDEEFVLAGAGILVQDAVNPHLYTATIFIPFFGTSVTTVQLFLY
jgi:hypothetical protein